MAGVGHVVAFDAQPRQPCADRCAHRCGVLADAGSEDQAIVAAVMALAGSLQMAVVAEGVENEAQLALLRRAGCQFAQGYLFARPVDAESVPALLTGA